MAVQMPHYNDAEKHQALLVRYICLLVFPHSHRQGINGKSCLKPG